MKNILFLFLAIFSTLTHSSEMSNKKKFEICYSFNTNEEIEELLWEDGCLQYGSNNEKLYKKLEIPGNPTISQFDMIYTPKSPYPPKYRYTDSSIIAIYDSPENDDEDEPQKKLILKTNLLELHDPCANKSTDKFLIPINNPVKKIVWSYNGKYFAIIYDQHLDIYNANKNCKQFSFLQENCNDISWSPDDSKIAICSANGYIKIINEQGFIYTSQHPGSSVNCLAWSKDNSKLAYALNNGTIIVLGKIFE